MIGNAPFDAATEPIRQDAPANLKKSRALDEPRKVFEAGFVPPGGTIPGRVVFKVALIIGLTRAPVSKSQEGPGAPLEETLELLIGVADVDIGLLR